VSPLFPFSGWFLQSPHLPLFPKDSVPWAHSFSLPSPFPLIETNYLRPRSPSLFYEHLIIFRPLPAFLGAIFCLLLIFFPGPPPPFGPVFRSSSSPMSWVLPVCTCFGLLVSPLLQRLFPVRLSQILCPALPEPF